MMIVGSLLEIQAMVGFEVVEQLVVYRLAVNSMRAFT
jgi:hypothetical protein